MASEKEALEKVQFYTEDDWKKFEKKVNDFKCFYLLITGFAIAFSTVALEGALSDLLLYIILGIGMGMVVMAFPFTYIRHKDIWLLKRLIKIELEEGKLILPPDFEYRRVFNMPFREKPEFSYQELEEIVESSHMMDPNTARLWGVAIVSSAGGAGMISTFLFESEALLVLIVFTGVSIPSILFFMKGHLMITLEAIIKYEMYTGEKVIPDELRERVYDIEHFEKF